MTTYILVADAARARVFTRDALTLVEHDSLVHAEGRLHEGDLVTDNGGDVHQSSTTAASASGGENVATQHHAERFAKEVAERLYRARVENDLEKLILVAPPRFLGQLRDKLDGPTAHRVIHSLSKDLSKASLATIQEAVSDLR
ncbi:host attachment protein [Halomonas sp. YLGW01]|uniref:host attachment protein n=1 Tax=Halomonas sp. YLGW01 TaxID=2773308 RepID=UPI0017812ED9|nr:host attachment protein [Halomonas sp. YLGW01]